MLRKTKESWKEIRRHWKGYSVVLVTVFFLPMIVCKTIDYISERKAKKIIKVNRDKEP